MHCVALLIFHYVTLQDKANVISDNERLKLWLMRLQELRRNFRK